MKIVTKLTAVLLTTVLLITGTSCAFYKKTYEIALVTDAGDIDDRDYNQNSWEGIVQYAEENSKTYKYYRSDKQDEASFLKAIDKAVDAGAKVVVCPGRVFRSAVERAQEEYKDIYFIAVDAELTNIASNTCDLAFSESQAGFLAGYAAVREGFKNLGFQGSALSPSIMSYGFGFIRGADYAAHEMALETTSIYIKYNCESAEATSADTQARAILWYESGTQVIFACGKNMCEYILPVAESSYNRWIIGADVDRSKLSETVISSALKEISSGVFNCLKRLYSNDFPAGETLYLSIAQDGVDMEMESSHWQNFSYEDYANIKAKLSDVSDPINLMLENDKKIDIYDMHNSSDFMAAFDAPYVLIEYTV